jgi:tRNA 5-methylaminomethyl-2-thiouridine biosynthesis bifunctional protein
MAPPPVRGFHQIDIARDVALVICYGDALEILLRAEGAIDAWFFDGFSPAKNPEMWRAEIFAAVARLSKPGATFATFTVAGEVRRNLAAAGFAAGKREGFGRKKEMLAGRIEAPARSSRRTPWFQNAAPRQFSTGASIAIIGGGVAGASLARSAARAGLTPTIFDPNGLAGGASGNPAGLIMPRIDLGESVAAEFFVAAYLHTIRLLRELDATMSQFAGVSGGRAVFNACGALLGAADDEERARQQKILAASILPEGWIEQREQGLFFPQAGVVNPPEFVRALAGAAPVVNAKVARVVHGANGPSIDLADGTRSEFDAVVIANGIDALSFLEARSLPLSPSLGQIDRFPDAPPPAHAIAYGPYAAPAPRGGVVIGATYEKAAPAITSRRATEENIAGVARFAPDLATRLKPEDAQSRAALRCQTPDRLPVAGPLPELAFYGGAYDDLRAGKNRDYPPGEMIPGVFILAGLGSRGLVTAPLAAAMIIAEMTGAPSPVPAEVAEALHPARFFIRDLRRAQTVRRG